MQAAVFCEAIIVTQHSAILQSDLCHQRLPYLRNYTVVRSSG